MSDTHFTPRRRALAVYFTDEDLIDLTVLYEKGLSDTEIAEALGVTRGVVKYQRHKLGLLHKRLFTDQELVDLHQEGYNDREMSEKLSASEAVIFYHRKRLGLKANRYTNSNRLNDRLIVLHGKGLNDREMAKELGISKDVVSQRRRRLRLKSNYKLKLIEKRER